MEKTKNFEIYSCNDSNESNLSDRKFVVMRQ